MILAVVALFPQARPLLGTLYLGPRRVGRFPDPGIGMQNIGNVKLYNNTP